ncbi:phage shock protein A [Tenacibaculum sp. Bg11-29]|uniref:PspA/IM30 family protein n=1 Tax=Tenacibaculum sp. Bg11-29 TaxID=2058306 RepID=UPI000C34F098|nr:PspA/IM30 family protein [Tenacibaculum sp. Bg11-29]PKH50987.1 phage shock protein A [Tenacibaculum sp. Bg11-29]
MNIFKRLFKIGQSETNSAIDKMEDPINMTEQGIRDLRDNLKEGLESLAQVKALAIRAKNDLEELTSKAEDYQQKAILILQKAKTGNLDSNEADRLAKEALIKKEETNKQASNSQLEAEKLNTSVTQLEHNVDEIKNNINKWENELKTLKARVKVSKATKNLNKQMAEIDNSSTVAMLERMKDKVNQEEALAEAYGDMAKSSKSIDDELNNAIDFTENNADNDLAKLKEQLGLNNKDI